MNPTLRTVLGVVCIGVITVCAILCFGRVAGRTRVADLTEQRLYTLSAGTKKLLGKLNQPITLKLFYARTAARKAPNHIRYWNNYYLYVVDLLEEYASRSQGKLTLEVIDPRRYTDEEDEAVKYGIRGIPLPDEEMFYFGLAATTELGKEETIPIFKPDRQEFVEYDVTKLLGGLMQRDKRKIGVLANVPILGADMSYNMMRMMGRQNMPRRWGIVADLQSDYDVEKVEVKDAAIPSDVDFLMVVHPKKLDDEALFAIDQYVMKGGKLMVFVDPHCQADRPPTMPGQRMPPMDHDASSNLNALLEKWGVTMDPKKIVADRSLGVMVRMGQFSPPAKSPLWLKLDHKCVNAKESVAADLHSVMMHCAGSLTKVDGAGTEVRDLLYSSKTGSHWTPSAPYELMYPDLGRISKAIVDGTEPLTLACLITGKLKTNFPDGYEIEVKDDDSDDSDDDGDGDGEAGDDAAAAKPATARPGTAAKPATAARPAPKPATAAKPTTAKPGTAAKPATAARPAPKPGTAAKPGTKDETAKKDEAAKKDEPEEKKTRVIPAVAEAAEGAQVFVIADVDFLTDSLACQETPIGIMLVSENSPFVFNILDYMSGSDDLIRVRTRGRYSRPFEKVDEIEEKAEKESLAEEKQIEDEIKKFQKDLEELGGAATSENIKVLQRAALKKREDLKAKIRKAEKQKKRLKVKKRERVEALEATLRNRNLITAPAVILVIATVLAVVRWFQARSYLARRQ